MDKSFEAEQPNATEQEAEKRIREELLREAAEKGRDAARYKIDQVDEYAKASAERFVSAQEAQDAVMKEYENLNNLVGGEKMHALNRISKYLKESDLSGFDIGIDEAELQRIREETIQELRS